MADTRTPFERLHETQKKIVAHKANATSPKELLDAIVPPLLKQLSWPEELACDCEITMDPNGSQGIVVQTSAEAMFWIEVPFGSVGPKARFQLWVVHDGGSSDNWTVRCLGQEVRVNVKETSKLGNLPELAEKAIRHMLNA